MTNAIGKGSQTSTPGLINKKEAKANNVTLGISLVLPRTSVDAMSITVAPATVGVTRAVYKPKERVF